MAESKARKTSNSTDGSDTQSQPTPTPDTVPTQTDTATNAQPPTPVLGQVAQPAPNLDQTVPGGRYRVDVTPQNPHGKIVDANGQEIKEDK